MSADQRGEYTKCDSDRCDGFHVVVMRAALRAALSERNELPCADTLNLPRRTRIIPMARESASRRHAGLIVGKLAFAAIAFCVASCATPVASLSPPRAGMPSRTVYVINHSILHTGIAVRRADIPHGLWPASHDYANSKYLEVGWGEDDGYRKPLSPRTAFHALRGSNRTVLLCDGFDRFDQPRPATIAIDLSPRGFHELCRYIERSYALDASGKPILLEPGWYRARGSYDSKKRH